LRDVHEHEADGAASYDDDGVAWLGVRFFEAANDTCQGLGKSGVLEGHVRGHEQRVLLDDTGGDGDVFGVGSVIKEEVVAEILLTAETEIALVAWSRVEGNHPIADPEISDAGADFVNNPGEFVSEWHGQGEHTGVIPTTVNLQIGTTGEGGLNANDDFSRTGYRYREALQAHIFAAV